MCKKKRRYSQPVMNDRVLVPLESAILSTSTTVEQSVVIEGQSVEGYFEDNDLSTDWGWETFSD